MTDTVTNNLEHRRGSVSDFCPTATRLHPETSAVPERPGSHYSDLLLKHLAAKLFQPSRSAVIGMVSFASGQGVTTTSVNLAVRAADFSYTPTLIVDADNRRGKITRHFRCSGTGLAECLRGQSEVNRSTRRTGVPGLDALGIGQSRLPCLYAGDPERVAEFVKQLRGDYAITVIDLPPLNDLAANHAVISLFDGLVMVARYGSHREQLSRMRQIIHNSGASVLGMVMTGDQEILPAWIPQFLR